MVSVQTQASSAAEGWEQTRARTSILHRAKRVVANASLSLLEYLSADVACTPTQTAGIFCSTPLMHAAEQLGAC
jgi:hypothetical protein